jgi:hypothetical protein
MECVFADINADHGNCAVEVLGHGVLLCAPLSLEPLARFVTGGAGARPDHPMSGHERVRLLLCNLSPKPHFADRNSLL